MKFTYAPGATPINQDEIDALIPSDVSTQDQLNEVEQENITDATRWAFSGKKKNVLSEVFIRKLHKQMFGKVWRWAGKYRKTDKNIGVSWLQIAPSVKKLVDDASYWIENKTYDWTEIAARLHHQLVWIHPFPNGNGRHARLYTNVVLMAFDQPALSWGTNRSEDNSKIRKNYIAALREADKKNFENLITFIQS